MTPRARVKTYRIALLFMTHLSNMNAKAVSQKLVFSINWIDLI